jgi:hypothetical protein
MLTGISIVSWIGAQADELRDEMVAADQALEPIEFRRRLHDRALAVILDGVLATGQATPEFHALVGLLTSTYTGVALHQTVRRSRQTRVAVPAGTLNLAAPGQNAVLRMMGRRSRRTFKGWLERLPDGRQMPVLEMTVAQVRYAADARWQQVANAALPPQVLDWAVTLACERGGTDDAILGRYVTAEEMDAELERLTTVERLKAAQAVTNEGMAGNGTDG